MKHEEHSLNLKAAPAKSHLTPAGGHWFKQLLDGRDLHFVPALHIDSILLEQALLRLHR